MALNDGVSFTWIGHGGWKIRTAGGLDMLIDPWLGAPTVPESLRTVDDCDLLVLTHGHFDHVPDAPEIAKRTGCTVVCPVEVAGWLGRQGVDEGLIVAGNRGGTTEVKGVKLTWTIAVHSSAMPDGTYGGEPCGYVIEFENGFKIYFSGDTDVFSDMALIRELDAPEVAFLCIGDAYTMGPRRAAKAAELLGVGTVVPMHFGTFPAMTGTPAELQSLVQGGVKVLDIKPGDTI